jgi:hypothetical protein
VIPTAGSGDGERLDGPCMGPTQHSLSPFRTAHSRPRYSTTGNARCQSSFSRNRVALGFVWAIPIFLPSRTFLAGATGTVTALLSNARTATEVCNNASLTCPSRMRLGLIKKHNHCAYCVCNGYDIWMPAPVVAEINLYGAYGRCTRQHKGP